jgi:putative transposase
MIRQASKVWLSAEERDELELFACSRTLPVRCVERARISLGCAAGHDNQQMGQELRVCRQTVGRWRERFVAGTIVARSMTQETARWRSPATHFAR